MPDPNTDRYSVEIKNLTTGQTVILAAVEMTDQGKNVVVRQLLRLSGAPAALWIEDDKPLIYINPGLFAFESKRTSGHIPACRLLTQNGTKARPPTCGRHALQLDSNAAS